MKASIVAVTSRIAAVLVGVTGAVAFVGMWRFGITSREGIASSFVAAFAALSMTFLVATPSRSQVTSKRSIGALDLAWGLAIAGAILGILFYFKTQSSVRGSVAAAERMRQLEFRLTQLESALRNAEFERAELSSLLDAASRDLDRARERTRELEETLAKSPDEQIAELKKQLDEAKSVAVAASAATNAARTRFLEAERRFILAEQRAAEAEARASFAKEATEKCESEAAEIRKLEAAAVGQRDELAQRLLVCERDRDSTIRPDAGAP